MQDQPGNMNGHVVYGQALFDAGRYDDSAATFNTALTLDPENLIALRHLGDISRLGNNPADALTWYRRVLDADPRNEEIQGFIEELSAAAPPPAAPAPEPQSAATPMATAPVPAPAPPPAAASGAPPSSEAVTGRPTRDSTPIMPVEAVPPKRPSVPLLDVEIDVGGDIPADPPTIEAPPAPQAPVGDIEIADLDFGDAATSAAPDGGTIELGSPADASVPADGGLEFGELDAAPAQDTLQFGDAGAEQPAAETASGGDAGFGWDVGMVDLDAPAAAPDEGASAGDTPQVFVTETMAELYLQQGFRDEALNVYRQLAAMNPEDASLRERVAALEAGGRASMSFEKLADEEPDLAPGTESLVPMDGETSQPDHAAEATARPDSSVPAAAAPVESARAYFARLAARKPLRADGSAPMLAAAAPDAAPHEPAGGSLDALFTGGAPDAADEAMGLALATAVGAASVPSVAGRPTEAATSELTLESVFRNESPMRVSGPVARQSQVLKFDQFFSTDPAADAADAAPPTPPSPATPPEPGVGADDAQFQAWLKGLKDQ